MSDQFPLFQHEPLNLSTKAIRVFRISAPSGVPADRVDCQLCHQADPIGHTAISYEWGTSAASHTIFVNDRPFKVGGNLFRLLQRLKNLENTKTYYWIDAISIDQTNLLERNHQVQQMKDIYSNASQVICWLGDTFSPCVDEVSNVLDETCMRYGCSQITDPQTLFGNVSALLERQAWNSHEVKKSNYEGHRVEGKTGVEASFRSVRGKERHPFWKGLRELCYAGYWRRAWIIQEFLLNANCHLLYGNNSTHAQTLSNFLQGCFYYELRYVLPKDHIDEPLQEWPATRLALQRGNEEILSGNGDLHDLLRSSTNAQCSDRRDRIYSLLSLCRTSLSVDYYEPAEALLLRIWASLSDHNLVDFLALTTALSVTPEQILQRCLLRRKYEPPPCRLNFPYHNLQTLKAPGTDYVYHQMHETEEPWVWTCSPALFTRTLTFCQCNHCRDTNVGLHGSLYVGGIWADGDVAFVSYRSRNEEKYSIGLTLAQDWDAGDNAFSLSRLHVVTPTFLWNWTPIFKSSKDSNSDLSEITVFERSVELTLHVKVAAQLGQFLAPEVVEGEKTHAWKIDEDLFEIHMSGHEQRLMELKANAQDRRQKWHARALEHATRTRGSNNGQRVQEATQTVQAERRSNNGQRVQEATETVQAARRSNIGQRVQKATETVQAKRRRSGPEIANPIYNLHVSKAFS